MLLRHPTGWYKGPTLAPAAIKSKNQFLKKITSVAAAGAVQTFIKIALPPLQRTRPGGNCYYYVTLEGLERQAGEKHRAGKRSFMDQQGRLTSTHTARTLRTVYLQETD